MKTLIMTITYVVITTTLIAQVDTAEKKLVPPDYATDSVYNSEKSLVQDTVKPDPDKPKVVSQPQETKSMQSPSKNQSAQNGYMLKNGKVFMIKNGQVSSTVETVSLANGSRLMKDGTIIKTDGNHIKMREGDFVDFSGAMMSTRPAENDQQPSDIQKSNSKSKEANPAVEKNKEPQKSNDKNMYLVPDSTIKDHKYQNPK